MCILVLNGLVDRIGVAVRFIEAWMVVSQVILRGGYSAVPRILGGYILISRYLAGTGIHIIGVIGYD